MAYCPSCGFEGTPKKGYCPNCRSKMEPGKCKGPHKRRDPRKKDNVARGIYWGVMLTIMILLLGMLFYPRIPQTTFRTGLVGSRQEMAGSAVATRQEPSDYVENASHSERQSCAATCRDRLRASGI